MVHPKIEWMNENVGILKQVFIFHPYKNIRENLT